MGHYHTEVEVRMPCTSTRDDAIDRAIADFLYENGHQHNLREVESAVITGSAPPRRTVTEPYGRRNTITYTKEFPEEPKHLWDVIWTVTLHTHA